MYDQSEHFSDNKPPEKPDAQALVIGCVNNKEYCNCHRHPESDKFYTIDINPNINPDYHMNIATDFVPNKLKNRFELTILEYLPYSTYNHDENSAQAGQKGMANIKEMTRGEGLIMVVGSARNFRFRRSLAGLNYMEIAESNDGTYVLIIPNNQELSVEGVNDKISKLPPQLHDSIKNSKTIGEQGRKYNPLPSNEFCRLNYQVTDANREIIIQLNAYIEKRMLSDEYLKKINILGFRYNFGYSKGEKMKAADALINVLLGNQTVDSLAPYRGALSIGVDHTLRQISNKLFGRCFSHAKKAVLAIELLMFCFLPF